MSADEERTRRECAAMGQSRGRAGGAERAAWILAAASDAAAGLQNR